MSQPRTSDIIHSLDLVKQVITEGIEKASGSCGGDCNNCPCSSEEPKSLRKVSENESSDACDKC